MFELNAKVSIQLLCQKKQSIAQQTFILTKVVEDPVANVLVET